jgi:hypothetical protein
LTHPFHCCAFKYPSRHDPIRHKQHLDFIRNLEKDCKGKKNASILDEKRKTSKRDLHRDLNENATHSDAELKEVTFWNDIDQGGFFLAEPVDMEDNLEALCGNLTLM